MTDDELIEGLSDIAKGLAGEGRKQVEELVLSYQRNRSIDLTVLSPGRRVDYERNLAKQRTDLEKLLEGLRAKLN